LFEDRLFPSDHKPPSCYLIITSIDPELPLDCQTGGRDASNGVDSMGDGSSCDNFIGIPDLSSSLYRNKRLFWLADLNSRCRSNYGLLLLGASAVIMLESPDIPDIVSVLREVRSG
jgi:hypothetical protein